MSDVCTYPFYIIILNDRNNSVFTISIQIPFISTSPESPLHELCNDIKQQLGINHKLIFLRFECETLVNDWYMPQAILLHMIDSVNETSVNHSWVNIANIDHSHLLPYNESVFNLIQTLHQSPCSHSSLFPYSKHGWYKTAQSWISSTLDLETNEFEMEQIQHTTFGCVIRIIDIQHNKYYFKCLPPAEDNNEIINSNILHSFLPQYFHSPLSANMENSWMLLKDYGTPLGFGSISIHRNTSLFYDILENWGKIQMESIKHVDTMMKQGMEVVTCSSIKNRLGIMSLDSRWYEAQVRGLKQSGCDIPSQSEYKMKLESYVERLDQNLKSFNIPLALVHGDLNPANVIRTNTNYTYFDFNTTCISYPIFDAITLGNVCGFNIDALQLYVNLWQSYEEPSRFREYSILVKDFSQLMYFLFNYEHFMKAEPSEKQNLMEEMESPLLNLIDTNK